MYFVVLFCIFSPSLPLASLLIWFGTLKGSGHTHTTEVARDLHTRCAEGSVRLWATQHARPALAHSWVSLSYLPVYHNV